jgi:hypothetical protein
MSLFIYPPVTTGVATEATALAILAFVDGVEALLSSIAANDFATQTTSAAILVAVDSVETLIGATNSNLVTIDGRVDGLETLVGSTNSKLDLIRKWPYATFDAQVFTPAALTDTWQYKTGGAGGTVVGTITTTYVDATKAVISNVVYSPIKVA